MSKPPQSEVFNSEPKNSQAWALSGLRELAMKGEWVEEIPVYEIDEQLKTIYVRRPMGIILAGCSDERPIVPESAAQIKQEFGLVADGPIVRVYGAATGAARIALVTLAMRQPEILAQYSGRGFETFTTEFANRSRDNAGVLFAVHSASANELQAASLNLDSHLGLGCAHAANTGLIAHNDAKDETVQSVSAGEAASLFGADKAKELPVVARANQVFIDEVLDGDETYGADRLTFDRLGLPVMILGGDHLPAGETEVVENYSIDQLADPRKAKEINRLHYTCDMTSTAEIIIKAFPEVRFDPMDIFLAAHHDIVATRGALAGGNPRKLKLSKHGDIEQALDYLRSLS